MFRRATISALLFGSLFTTAATAEEPARTEGALSGLVTVTATIDHGDLDLRTEAGVAEARRRLTDAVRELCRPPAVPAGPGPGRLDGFCYRQALASARAQFELAVAARNRDVQTALNQAPSGDAGD